MVYSSVTRTADALLPDVYTIMFLHENGLEGIFEYSRREKIRWTQKLIFYI